MASQRLYFTGVVNHNGEVIDLFEHSVQQHEPNFGLSKRSKEFITKDTLWLNIGPFRGHRLFAVWVVEGLLQVVTVDDGDE